MKRNNYDFIVVGSGPAGATVTYNLAKNFPSKKILLLECGQDDARVNNVNPNPNVVSPIPNDWGQLARTALSQVGEGCLQWQVEAVNSATGPPNISYQRGSTWGGTSTINGATWNRGTKQGTYDKWEEATKDPEWGWDNTLKSFKRLENRSQTYQYFGSLPFRNYWTPDIPGYLGFDKELMGDTGQIYLTQDVLDGYLTRALNETLATQVLPGRNHPLPILQIPEDPNNPQEYAFLAAVTQYDQSGSNYDKINPYPNNTLGTTYTPPGQPSNAKGPEYTANPLRITNPSTIPPNSTGGIKNRTSRVHAGTAFVYPLVDKKVPNNVTVVSRAFVTKILFEDDITSGGDCRKCVGVEYAIDGWLVTEVARNQNNPDCSLEQAKQNQKEVTFVKAYAKHDTWICCGVIDSPALLQRSGIGPKEVLQNAGVICRKNLPVGLNGVEDVNVHINWLSEVNLSTGLNIPSGIPDISYVSNLALADRSTQSSASIAGAPVDIGSTLVRVKSNPNVTLSNFTIQTVPVFFPSFGAWNWNDLSGAVIGLPSRFNYDTIVPTYTPGDEGFLLPMPNSEYLYRGSLKFMLHNAKSRSTVLIKNADVFSRPIYNPNLLQNPDDLKNCVEMLEFTIIPLLRGMENKRYGPAGTGLIAGALTPVSSVEWDGPNRRNFVRLTRPSGDEIFTTDQEFVLIDPFVTQTGSNNTQIIVVHANHGFEDKEIIKISGATTFNGVDPNAVNTFHVITLLNSNNYTITLFYNLTKLQTTGVMDNPGATSAGPSSNQTITVHKLRFDREKASQWIKKTKFTAWHGTSTCRMGDHCDENAVVDTRCRVRGIKNLRVCDASVFPTKPDGNTVAQAYLVGDIASRLACKKDYCKI